MASELASISKYFWLHFGLCPRPHIYYTHTCMRMLKKNLRENTNCHLSQLRCYIYCIPYNQFSSSCSNGSSILPLLCMQHSSSLRPCNLCTWLSAAALLSNNNFILIRVLVQVNPSIGCNSCSIFCSNNRLDSLLGWRACSRKRDCLESCGVLQLILKLTWKNSKVEEDGVGEMSRPPWL